MESNNLTLLDQLSKIRYAKSKLENERLINRLEQILFKNPDYYYLENMNEEEIIALGLMYLNITTVNVERSFNYLKLLLSDNRRSLKSKNIFNYLFLAGFQKSRLTLNVIDNDFQNDSLTFNVFL